MNLRTTLGFTKTFTAFGGGSSALTSEAFFIYMPGINGFSNGSICCLEEVIPSPGTIGILQICSLKAKEGAIWPEKVVSPILSRENKSRLPFVPAQFHGYREPQLSGGVSCASKIGSDSNQHKQTPLHRGKFSLGSATNIKSSPRESEGLVAGSGDNYK